MIEEYILYILPSISLLLAAATLIWLLRPLRLTGKASADPESSGNIRTPGISVIVYSQGREEELIEYLDSLTAQIYPDFEVIVVSESTAESNEILAESCSRRYRNVYVTFIPPGSHNLSRRKLALTLGMKAAKGEIVVTTISNARIPSESWLSSMVAPFAENPDIDVALGYSRLDFRQMKGWGKWYREFCSLLTDARWIGYALAHKPYRGDGYNLAFRRHIFFDHKGYSQSMYLHPGDDDIFISEIATPENTAMVTAPESMLTIEWGDASTRMWRARKEQYDFTSRWLPRAPFLLGGMASLMQWLILLCTLTAVAIPILNALLFSVPIDAESMILAGTALIIWLCFLTFEVLIYRKAAGRLGATRLWWAVGPFWLAKPILNLIFRLRYRRQLRNNFTWLRR